MSIDILWDCEQSITDLGIDVPDWIDQDITAQDVAAILQGGCDSGAYVPAVTYWDAARTMGRHGDAVLGYLQDQRGKLPAPRADVTWPGLAVHYLSAAVELWASNVEGELETAIEDIADDDETEG